MYVRVCKPISVYVECNSQRAARPFWLKVQSAIHLTRGQYSLAFETHSYRVSECPLIVQSFSLCARQQNRHCAVLKAKQTKRKITNKLLIVGVAAETGKLQ